MKNRLLAMMGIIAMSDERVRHGRAHDEGTGRRDTQGVARDQGIARKAAAGAGSSACPAGTAEHDGQGRRDICARQKRCSADHGGIHRLPVPVLRPVRGGHFSRDQKEIYRHRQDAPDRARPASVGSASFRAESRTVRALCGRPGKVLGDEGPGVQEPEQA